VRKERATDIIRIPGDPSAGSRGNTIKLNFASLVRVTRYLCGTCGFSEEWIDSPSDISKLKAKFSPTPG
jgi:hypothetical protein